MLATDKVLAIDLTPNDQFKMGGNHFRISSTSTNEFGDAVLCFYQLDCKVLDMSRLVIHPMTKFKVYKTI